MKPISEQLKKAKKEKKRRRHDDPKQHIHGNAHAKQVLKKFSAKRINSK